MKILLSSNKFYPSLGGLETVSALLAREFTRLGQDVTVVTETPHGGAEETFPGRRLRMVRCKHSGLPLELSIEGPPFPPSSRYRGLDLPQARNVHSARFEGGLDEVFEAGLRKVA